jgi:hypothetical protein
MGDLRELIEWSQVSDPELDRMSMCTFSPSVNSPIIRMPAPRRTWKSRSAFAFRTKREAVSAQCLGSV